MNPKKLPNVDYLETMFKIYPKTGMGEWKIRKGMRVKVGDIIGEKKGTGYLQTQIDGSLYLWHRIIYKIL